VAISPRGRRARRGLRERAVVLVVVIVVVLAVSILVLYAMRNRVRLKVSASLLKLASFSIEVESQDRRDGEVQRDPRSPGAVEGVRRRGRGSLHD
jgi:cytochrome c-type biogenesis protein CcmE